MEYNAEISQVSDPKLLDGSVDHGQINFLLTYLIGQFFYFLLCWHIIDVD